jgi:hypothetical protein
MVDNQIQPTYLQKEDYSTASVSFMHWRLAFVFCAFNLMKSNILVIDKTEDQRTAMMMESASNNLKKWSIPIMYYSSSDAFRKTENVLNDHTP